MKKLIFCFLLVLQFSGCKVAEKSEPHLYLNQKLPGDTPEIFAPGIVNDGIPTRDITFMPDGKEIYFGKNTGNFSYATIFYCKQTDNGWSAPEVVPFATNPKYIYIEPFISPDGKKLFFVSNQGNDFSPENPYITDIWVAERESNTWGTPYKLDTTVNSKQPEFFPSVSEKGNLYFTREIENSRENFIYKSQFLNGVFQLAEKLPEQVNAGRARFNAAISKDESLMIIPIMGMEDSYGSTDYYVTFFDKTRGWSDPLNLGNKINSSGGREYSANFSPDGKYFFFMATSTNSSGKVNFTLESFRKLHNSAQNGYSNIYWLKSDFISNLKEKAIFTQK